MEIKRFKNTNINIKLDNEERELSTDELFFKIVNSYELDFSIPFDSGCASNYEMYHPLYCNYNDRLYLVLDSDLDKLREGKTVKLVGRELDEYEREELEEYYNYE